MSFFTSGNGWGEGPFTSTIMRLLLEWAILCALLGLGVLGFSVGIFVLRTL